jgi:redox-sensitive bicupin YhaK (pirin superfamily)
VIQLENKSSRHADIIVFGGEPYAENIVAHGPFVRNSRQEIAQAFYTHRAGEYGAIIYPQNP